MIEQVQYESWICSSCKSQIPLVISQCQNCQSISKFDSNPIQYVQCSNCTYHNNLDSSECLMCQSPISIPSKKNLQKSKQKLNNLTQCKMCQSLNNPQNNQCKICGFFLNKKQQTIQCTICKNKVSNQNYNQHLQSCQLSMKSLMSMSQQKCTYCGQVYDIYEIPTHQPKCYSKLFNNQISYQVAPCDWKQRLTQLQIEVVNYMQQKSQKSHNSCIKSIQNKVKKLNYQNQHLQNLYHYVQNVAPIIIHVHLIRYLKFFIKDTHYRSQFQTNTSSGSLCRASRTSWQDRMFDKKYLNATDYQRVKYGTINLTNDRKGVKCCSAYGPSYFVLKNHVRYRCTFTDKDSSNSDSIIGTFKYCFGVLDRLNDNELKGALEGSNQMQVGSECISTYKQIQIHGPIQFNKDMEKLYVSYKEIGDNKQMLKLVFQFSENNMIPMQFID